MSATGELQLKMDSTCLSEHLASVGRGSNHDAHDADISLASRSGIFSARRRQHGWFACAFYSEWSCDDHQRGHTFPGFSAED